MRSSAGAPLLLAQYGTSGGGTYGGGTTGGTAGTPTLTDNKTSQFSASSKSAAQKICNEVATRNGKSSCTAEMSGSMWYCICK